MVRRGLCRNESGSSDLGGSMFGPVDPRVVPGSSRHSSCRTQHFSQHARCFFHQAWLEKRFISRPETYPSLFREHTEHVVDGPLIPDGCLPCELIEVDLDEPVFVGVANQHRQDSARLDAFRSAHVPHEIQEGILPSWSVVKQ
jgi:hypothetical protein